MALRRLINGVSGAMAHSLDRNENAARDTVCCFGDIAAIGMRKSIHIFNSKGELTSNIFAVKKMADPAIGFSSTSEISSSGSKILSPDFRSVAVQSLSVSSKDGYVTHDGYDRSDTHRNISDLQVHF